MIGRSPTKRPFHWGPYALEELSRDASLIEHETRAPVSKKPPAIPQPAKGIGRSAWFYGDLFSSKRRGRVAPAKAPVPDDLKRRTQDIKGACYFFGASQVGICKLPERAWYESGQRAQGETHAIVLLVAHGRTPEVDNLAHDWVDGDEAMVARTLGAEIVTSIAGYIRDLGFNATAHWPGESETDLDRLGVLAGLTVRSAGKEINPFLDDRFSLAVISTDYALDIDLPLAESSIGRARGLRYWLGWSGAVSGFEWRRRERRASHMSQYPMEQVRRVDRPTTLIIDEEVPRVPQRASFFDRALRGDLGAKAQRERYRFAYKHPLSNAMLAPMDAMVPYQEGPVGQATPEKFDDPSANSRAIKSLGYHMGADLVGICEVPDYAWYSHNAAGEPIEIKHKYAVVMLIDQGYATMEGASGDDWISGVQSMRAYLRGATLSGMMADFVRRQGFPSRSQSNRDSQVLQIPLILWAGLGELSRIGELVLNPFVGPRFKSVVFTTDMPLETDKPIDFRLQYFCSNCLKCARECPCDAIPFGDKVMFNGYEIWKPDVERCARYRLTNIGGAACGRCMKTCPLNKVVDADGPILTRLASWLGVNAMWLKPLLVPIAVKLDDLLGHGKRVPIMKWWLDLEFTGEIVEKAKRVNQRDINPGRKVDGSKIKFAHYPASAMPPGNQLDCFPVDRARALEATGELETVDDARERAATGGPKPEFYNPPAPLPDVDD